jgi:hypothetical protein
MILAKRPDDAAVRPLCSTCWAEGALRRALFRPFVPFVAFCSSPAPLRTRKRDVLVRKQETLKLRNLCIRHFQETKRHDRSTFPSPCCSLPAFQPFPPISRFEQLRAATSALNQNYHCSCTRLYTAIHGFTRLAVRRALSDPSFPWLPSVQVQPLCSLRALLFNSEFENGTKPASYRSGLITSTSIPDSTVNGRR